MEVTVTVIAACAAFAVFGYLYGRAVGYRHGRRVGYDTGRKCGAFWQQWNGADDGSR